MLAIHLLLSNVHRGDTQPRSNIAFTAPRDNWLWANNLYKASAHPFLCSLFTLGVSTPTDLLTVLPLVLFWCTLLRFYTSLWCTGYTVPGALYPCDYVHIPPQSSHFSLSPSVPLSMSRNVTHINYVYLHSGYAKITLSTLFLRI